MPPDLQQIHGVESLIGFDPRLPRMFREIYPFARAPRGLKIRRPFSRVGNLLPPGDNGRSARAQAGAFRSQRSSHAFKWGSASTRGARSLVRSNSDNCAATEISAIDRASPASH